MLIMIPFTPAWAIGRYSSIFIIVIALSLTACIEGDGIVQPDPVVGPGPAEYTVGGSVFGLTGSGLVLQNNGADDLAVAGNSFEFATALTDGSTYNVTILTQPTGQTCSAINGSGTGTLSGANVTDVVVKCRNWAGAQLLEDTTVGAAAAADIAIDS
ncbi:MAG: hypothetical protein KAJ19_03390, partial [Gammaproteobacteria bacterium]|nr:hypothetical protein [Gammaproteobacteria bacterium]